MLELLLWVISFLFFTVVISKIQLAVNKSRFHLERRIAPLITTQLTDEPSKDSGDMASFSERVMIPIFRKLEHFLKKRMPHQKIKDLEKKLRDAGNPFGLTGIDFIVVQLVISLVIVLFVSFVLLPNTQEYGKVIVLTLAGFIFIMFYSNYYINTKKKFRTQQIEKDMPDFFDMVTISIEAGMGLDGAIKRVCKEMNSPLSEEFLFAIDDMKLGKSRKQALNDLKNRVASEFLQSVVSALLQADQMGIGISKVLQAQTIRIREQQRQVAKEKAMKAPVKMLIPMVIFIFPTLFVVLIGPALVQFITNWM